MSGKKATTNIIPGDYALSVGKPEKKLPKNWIWVNLEDVAELATGHTPSRKIPEYWGGEIPWMAVGDARKFHGKKIFITKEYTNDLGIKKSAAVLLPTNTVCLSRTASIGYSIMLGRPMATSQGFVNWICSDLLLPRFLQTIFMTEKRFLHEISEGTAHTTIYFPEVKAFHIAMPPIAEQNRIVAKLDALFAQLETIKTSMANIPLLLKDFRQQVLTQAVTGKLTEDDKKQNNLGAWKENELKNVCKRITVGFVGKTVDKYRENGIPFLRSQNVRAFKYDDKNLMYIDQGFHNQIKKSSISAGDVAIVRSGYPGTTCVIPETIKIANCSDILVLTTKPEFLNPHFVAIFMNSEFGKEIVFQGKVGMAQQHFNTKKLQETIIKLPSIFEQQEIVSKVESLFAKADAIEKQYETLKAKIETLPQALLHKAFKGELVAQLESDGDAKDLLEAIQQLKGEGKAVKKYKVEKVHLGMVAEKSNH